MQVGTVVGTRLVKVKVEVEVEVEGTGAAAEEGITRTRGIEVMVKLDGTNTTGAYVQDAKGTSFYNGQRVRITTTSNGTARVVPL